LNINEIFTQYNGSIYKSLNIDPLGFQVVWTYFGQNIFENKVTSIALDIRSYNINLFNHLIIYKLIRENYADSEISQTILKLVETRTGIEKLLVILENMLTWSWFTSINSDNKWSEDQKRGLLGTSKVLSLWLDKEELYLNCQQAMSDLEVLKNQKSLGISGRYKGPFIKMGFFDSYYSLNSYKNAEELFLQVEMMLLKDSSTKKLYKQIMNYFKEYDSTQKISHDLINSFNATFKDTKILNTLTKEFWLNHLGLKNFEAKALYKKIKLENKDQSIKFIFMEVSGIKSEKIDNIIHIEPKLSYIQLLFDYILLQDGKEIQELSKEYIKILKNFICIDVDTKSSAKNRIDELQKVQDYQSLLEYHQQIMKSRGQFPWVEIIENRIRVNISKNKTLERIEEGLQKGIENIEWIHDYYIYSIRNIKQGLER